MIDEPPSREELVCRLDTLLSITTLLLEQQGACVCCGRSGASILGRYCSRDCARDQALAVRELLNTTPRRALSVAEWHDLGRSVATDLEFNRRLTEALQ